LVLASRVTTFDLALLITTGSPPLEITFRLETKALPQRDFALRIRWLVETEAASGDFALAPSQNL